MKEIIISVATWCSLSQQFDSCCARKGDDGGALFIEDNNILISNCLFKDDTTGDMSVVMQSRPAWSSLPILF